MWKECSLKCLIVMIGRAQTTLLLLAMLKRLQMKASIQKKHHKTKSFCQALIAAKAKDVLLILPKRDLVKNLFQLIQFKNSVLQKTLRMNTTALWMTAIGLWMIRINGNVFIRIASGVSIKLTAHGLATVLLMAAITPTLKTELALFPVQSLRTCKLR